MISKISSHSFLLKLFNIPPILSISLLRFLFPILFLVTLNTFPQEGDIAAGKQLFNTNCASCHKLDRKMTGPALRNVEARLAEDEGLDREWLYKWIRNSYWSKWVISEKGMKVIYRLIIKVRSFSIYIHNSTSYCYRINDGFNLCINSCRFEFDIWINGYRKFCSW